MIIDCYTGGPFETHSILLGCSETLKACVIDAPFGACIYMKKRAQELGLTLECLLLTHSHWDHTADAAAFKKLGMPIFIHALDSENLKSPGSDGLPMFYPIDGVIPDQFIADGQILSVGKMKLEVWHTPGHTPGSVCFYIKDEDLLISGDTLFKESIGNLSFPTARPKLMWPSLKRLLTLPRRTRVIPGHGEETTIGAEEKWLRALIEQQEEI
jgi:hydroxyacylglutathione hydrolase